MNETRSSFKLYDASIEMFDCDEIIHLPPKKTQVVDQTKYAEINKSSKAPGLLYFDGRYMREARNVSGFEPGMIRKPNRIEST